MSSTEARAPFPTSPHANVFTCGAMIRTMLELSPPLVREAFQNPWTVANWVCVNGCSHIAVFMAGARRRGFPGRGPWPKSQARTTHEAVSSQKPWAILASVWADRGATKRTSAQSTRRVPQHKEWAKYEIQPNAIVLLIVRHSPKWWNSISANSPLRSIWSTGSPNFCHSFHSSSAPVC